MKQYYRMNPEIYNKINILMNNIRIAEGLSNAVNFAQLGQLLQQVEVITEEEVVDSDS